MAHNLLEEDSIKRCPCCPSLPSADPRSGERRQTRPGDAGDPLGPPPCHHQVGRPSRLDWLLDYGCHTSPRPSRALKRPSRFILEPRDANAQRMVHSPAGMRSGRSRPPSRSRRWPAASRGLRPPLQHLLPLQAGRGWPPPHPSRLPSSSARNTPSRTSGRIRVTYRSGSGCAVDPDLDLLTLFLPLMFFHLRALVDDGRIEAAVVALGERVRDLVNKSSRDRCVKASAFHTPSALPQAKTCLKLPKVQG